MKVGGLREAEDSAVTMMAVKDEGSSVAVMDRDSLVRMMKGLWWLG